MTWFFVTLPLVVLMVAVATIPRLVPAVREQRASLAGVRHRSNGHGRLTPGPPPTGEHR